jgi:hypothetical protein
VAKKTAIDRFNDSRQEESRRLTLKRKMEHDEKMASICLKRHKYDLRYGSTDSTSLTPESSTPALATLTKEDKEIEILRLKIRLAELTRDNSAHASSTHASSSQMPHASSYASSSQIPYNSLEEASTPNSGMSNPSYLSDPGLYHVPEDEASNVGADSMTSWPETYNFS